MFRISLRRGKKFFPRVLRGLEERLAPLAAPPDNGGRSQGTRSVNNDSRTARKSLRTGVIMDPVAGINIKKDSTFAMMLEAQRRGHEVLYMEPEDLWVAHGEPRATMRPIVVRDDPEDWFELGPARDEPLADLDIVLMRRDPPFDMDYVHVTYMLELAEARGVLVINRPQSLRDANEKFFITRFPECCTPFAIMVPAYRGGAPRRKAIRRR